MDISYELEPKHQKKLEHDGWVYEDEHWECYLPRQLVLQRELILELIIELVMQISEIEVELYKRRKK